MVFYEVHDGVCVLLRATMVLYEIAEWGVRFSENHCAQERASGARACVLWCSMRFVTGASTSKETIARARSAAGACSCAQCSRSMRFMTGVCISKEIIARNGFTEMRAPVSIISWTHRTHCTQVRGNV